MRQRHLPYLRWATLRAIWPEVWEVRRLQGSLGAVVAETFVELASPDAEVLNQRLQERAEAENIDLRDAAQREGLVRFEMSGLIGAGETLAASTAMLFDQDPTLAASSARMALENNFLPCLLLASSALYEAYDVLCVYRADGAEAALKAVAMKLGVAAATVTIGGPVLKAVVSKAMAANPALAKALGVFGEKLVSVSNVATEALGTTAVGRSVLAVETALESGLEAAAGKVQGALYGKLFGGRVERLKDLSKQGKLSTLNKAELERELSAAQAVLEGKPRGHHHRTTSDARY